MKSLQQMSRPQPLNNLLVYVMLHYLWIALVSFFPLGEGPEIKLLHGKVMRNGSGASQMAPLLLYFSWWWSKQEKMFISDVIFLVDPDFLSGSRCQVPIFQVTEVSVSFTALNKIKTWYLTEMETQSSLHPNPSPTISWTIRVWLSHFL